MMCKNEIELSLRTVRCISRQKVEFNLREPAPSLFNARTRNIASMHVKVRIRRLHFAREDSLSATEFEHPRARNQPYSPDQAENAHAFALRPCPHPTSRMPLIVIFGWSDRSDSVKSHTQSSPLIFERAKQLFHLRRFLFAW